MIRFKNRYRKSPMYQYKFALDKVYNDNKSVCNIISFCKRYLLTYSYRVMYTVVEGLLL